MQSEMRRCLFPLGWGTGHFNPLLVSEMLKSRSSRSSLFTLRYLPQGSGGQSQRAGDGFGFTGEEDCSRLWP